MDARYSPMLCTAADELPPDAERWALEPKFDGWRAIVVLGAAGVTVYGGRNGNEYTGKVPYIEAALAGALPKGTVLDGELIAPAGWGNVQSTMTSSAAHAPSAVSPALTFVVFDVLELNGNDMRAMPWENRRSLLEMVTWPPFTTLTPTGDATPEKHSNMLDLGMEGSVVKRRSSRYINSRSRDWLKLKAIASEDCTIVAFEDGKGGRTGEIGAIVVRLPSGVETTASGMTDAVRADMLVHPDAYLGKTVEIVHNGVMASGKLRHPRFKRMRDDKAPEAAPAATPARKPRAARASSPKMRNYHAMRDPKWSECIASFKNNSGEHYQRAVDDPHFTVDDHKRALAKEMRARGLAVPAFW